VSTLKERKQSERKEEKSTLKMKTIPKKIGAVVGIYKSNTILNSFDSLSALLHDRYCKTVVE
jgi:hypothetical protein